MGASLPFPSAAQLFGTGLSQHARLITLASVQDTALPEALMAERFTGREGVNELFAFDVDALSVSTDLDLSAFIGEELTVTLQQPDGSRRAWHGLCTQAAWLGADGGVARYRLKLEPALALLALRRDSYVFQDKDARQIVTELLSDYPQVRFEFDVTQELAPRAVCTQYRESDLEFVTRLLASEGLSWRFEHAQPDDDSQDGQARHKLVIFDSQARIPEMPDDATLRFHGMRATDTDDAIDQFGAQRRIAPNAVTISSWDPAQLLAPASEQQSSLDLGEVPTLAIHDGSGERIASGFENGATPDLHSRLMLQALEQDNKLFDGAGAVRRLAPGHGFHLAQHDRYPEGQNGFTVLWVEHDARNNFTAQIRTHRDGVENGTYRNRFACIRDAVAIVPRAIAAPQPVTAPGPQTALVVGLPDAVATTTRDHQVKIQFAWQRGTGANPGGLTHDTDEEGNAPGDERSGTWVRVAEALAGPNWGSQFTPRIGTEVLVDFIEGDIDRPIVVAQLYTGSDLPPFTAGVDSQANHPGTLSGIHTNAFDGAGYNQWQLDDTRGQVRMRLATSAAATQLNLGYLIAQTPGTARRGSYRGSGFELRTDAWAVVRGGDGVLLTTTARAGAVSTQMDAAEALGSLKSAHELAKTIGEAAVNQHALSSAEALKAHADTIALLDPEDKGKFDGDVNGHAAQKAQDGSRELDAEQPVEKFGAPLVVMDAPSIINWATQASTVLFAGQQLQWIAQGDVHVAAGATVSTVAANAASFFTHAGGIQAIAAQGPVSVQAHTDQLEILADKSVSVVSVSDSIEIKANQKIVLQAGQSSVTLEGGDITFACPGEFSVKGGQHVFDGAARKTANLRSLPGQLTTEQNWIALHYLDPYVGEGIAAAEYEIHFEGGRVLNGKLDDQGQAHHDNVERKRVTKVIYKPRTPESEKPAAPFEDLANG
ncbi:type VI secretion system secreted protein VgrG [Pseudoduganella flava]|uniref:Type VI secretion system secreted protein VgrG n=1 Tax=Pseudoduganella flava TaxID=871742 RepID=A0A562PIC1_9BURK|nr:type VI secretion system Vgr family protein [Pseudoduganella flava]QGZ37657.1 type VI secretion system tip protein VgrG [Pseudoduganella flava]TWI43980.1 type VI secretion system secreted protein VgrG [Pseudoduganella flava]